MALLIGSNPSWYSQRLPRHRHSADVAWRQEAAGCRGRPRRCRAAPELGSTLAAPPHVRRVPSRRAPTLLPPWRSKALAARSVARAIFDIFFLCCFDDSFTRTLYLSDYSQGRDRFTSPFVCKLYGGCKWYKNNAKDRLCFPNASNIYKPSKSPFNTGSSGIPDSRSPIFLYNYLNPESVRELPLPAPQPLSEQKED